MKNEYVKIYCDFDGTISKIDTVNEFLRLFADKSWLEIEELWAEGKISSRECLQKQVELLPEMNEETLQKYIDSIEISDGFIQFCEYARSIGAEIIILSDGFDLFIKKTLEKYSISEIKYFANTLHYENNKFSVEFNNHYEHCDIKAGNCKCAKVREKDFCYIGDGISDFCVARKAKKIFAKKNLKKYCDKMSINYTDFDDFKDIIKTFREEGRRLHVLN